MSVQVGWRGATVIVFFLCVMKERWIREIEEGNFGCFVDLHYLCTKVEDRLHLVIFSDRMGAIFLLTEGSIIPVYTKY